MFNGNSYRVARSRELMTDISCDYVLPDYLGEVRKILMTEARVIPLPAYMSGDDAKTLGTVNFKMVYMDSENRISCAEFSEDYEMSESVGDDGLCATSSSTRIDGYSMRLLGPRKISAKARVEARLMSVFEEENTLGGNAFEEGEVELATESAAVACKLIGDSAEREYADELGFIEGAISDEVEIPYSSVETAVHEMRICEGEVLVSGEHLVSALVKCGDEPIYQLRRSIPFAESLVLVDACEDMYPSVEACVTSLKISPNPTDTGTSITASLITEYMPSAVGNREITIVTDGYMKDREVEIERGVLELDELILSGTFCDKAEASRGVEELSLPGCREIFSVSADGGVKSVDISDKSIKILSEIRISAIACEVNEDMSLSYVPVKYSMEYEKEIVISPQNHERVHPQIDMKLNSAEGYVDGDKVCLSVNAEICAEVYEMKSYDTLSVINATDKMHESRGANRIYVYYPDSDDTLFSVARRFHTTTERVAIDNSLTEAALADKNGSSSLHGVEMLIIK